MNQWSTRQRQASIGKSSNTYHSRPWSASLAGSLAAAVGLLDATSAAAADDIEILAGGELKFGVTMAENELLSEGEGDRGYAFFTDSELYIEVDVSPAEDLEIGIEIVLEADADQLDEVNADETYMFFSGAFGLMQLGRTEGAEDGMALGADTIAAGTGGIDGDTENLGDVQVVTSGDAAKISYYTPRIGGLQLGASFAPDTGDEEGDSDTSDDASEDFEDHLGVGLNFVQAFGDHEVGAAVVGSFGSSEEVAGDDLAAFSIGGTLALQKVDFGASYGEVREAVDFDFATIGITFGLEDAAAGIGYNYVDEKGGAITHVIVLSGDIGLFEGVELQSDVSYADPKDERTNIASVVALEVSF